MAVCPRCQKEVSEAYQYCPFCNSEIHPTEVKAVVEPKQEEPKPMEPETAVKQETTSSEDRSSEVMLKGVLGILGWLTMIAGIIAGFVIANDDVPVLLGIVEASIISGCLFLWLKRVLINQEEIRDTLEEILYNSRGGKEQ